MDVPKKYRSAVEAYLGANIQNIVVEDASSAKACVAYLKKGKIWDGLPFCRWISSKCGKNHLLMRLFRLKESMV